MDTKEAQEEEAAASKQEGKQGGQVKKEQRGEQGKSFAFHLARRLTVQQRSSIDVCHGSQARSGEFQCVEESGAERSVVSCPCTQY